VSSVFVQKKKDNYYVIIKRPGEDPITLSVRKELGLDRPATPKEAKDLKRQKENELAGRGLIDSQDITVGDWMLKFLDSKKYKIRGKAEGNGRDKSTYFSYKNTIENHINKRSGNRPLKAFDEDDAQALINDIAATGEIRTARLAYTLANAAFKRAVKRNKIAVNPFEDIELPTYEPREKIIWSDDQSTWFIREIPQYRLYPFYALTIAMGNRRGEGLGLTWDAIDFDARVIHIKQSLDSDRDIGDTKTKKGTRKVPIDKKTMNILREHRKNQLEELMKLGVRNEGNLVFLSEVGTPYCPRNVLRNFKDVVIKNINKKIRAETIKEMSNSKPKPKEQDIEDEIKKRSLPVIDLHSLRHLYVSWLIAAGENLKTIQELIGHSRPSTTLDIYVHLFEELKHEAANKIGAKLDKLQKKATSDEQKKAK
jgi:integrase